MKKIKIDTSKIPDLSTAIQIIEELLIVMEKQQEEIDFFTRKNRQLKKRGIQLETKVAGLSLNSSNPSKPPSSDIFFFEKKPPIGKETTLVEGFSKDLDSFFLFISNSNRFDSASN